MDPAPFVALVGAEYEENLSLRYLAAAAQAAGFPAEILAYDDAGCRDRIAARILAQSPAVVGISVPFQHRAAELLDLATHLRARGYQGHITAGGHFATFEYAAILRHVPALDSIVRHEGEATLVELCTHLRDGQPLTPFPGIVLRAAARPPSPALDAARPPLPVLGAAARPTLPVLATAARPSLPVLGAAARPPLPVLGAEEPPAVHVGPKRPLPPLDSLPFPDRRGAPHHVLGVPCSPIIGSRGCYADCSFCCIFAYADNADGARYRMRAPETIVAEMEQEYHRRGVRLFVFHDDNFFVPDRRRNLARYQRLAELVRAAGLTDIGLVIKCRPNDVDRELFLLLRDLGVIRAYVGIETNSDEGVVSLNRRITPADNERALSLLAELGIYCSFNVLIFDPEATLDGVAANFDFMARHAEVPFNFCRAEVYAGTPLQGRLQAQGRLRGDYLAWDYQMRDERVEVLFRIVTTAFFGRNFKPDGIANLNMGIRFDNEVLRRFYQDAWDPAWEARLRALSRQIGEDSVAYGRAALHFARTADVHDDGAVHSFTIELARHIARRDLLLLGQVKGLRREMDARARGAGADGRRFGQGMPPWAAETGRLGALHSSTGRELSTEILPVPSRAAR